MPQNTKTFRATGWLSFSILAAFIAVVVVVGGAIGVLTAPGEWYAGLAKPPFNPPNWLFAPVWLVLYVLIGIAGWRVWRRFDGRTALTIWGAQQALNWLWSPVFFTLHQLWPAAAIIVAIFALIVAFIAVTWRLDRPAALMFVPYALWVGFASTLNIAVALLNP